MLLEIDFMKIYLIKAGVNLNGIFAPLNTGLVQISRSHFKQSKNSMLKTRIYATFQAIEKCHLRFVYEWTAVRNVL